MTAPLQLATARVQHLKKIEEASPLDLLCIDTTVKSGGPELSPTWNLVMGYKNQEINAVEYADQFGRLMTESQQRHTSYWDDLVLSEIPVVLGCYCKANDFCHRYLLLDQITEYALKQHGITTQYLGEASVNSEGELVFDGSAGSEYAPHHPGLLRTEPVA